jgi:hypothetical protein
VLQLRARNSSIMSSFAAGLMFSAEITTLSENAGPFYPCLIHMVNSTEILSVSS